MNSSELVSAIQNPALGALAIWQFVVGYANSSENGAPLDYIYTVLPLISNSEMRDVICHTNGGLLAYRTKLSKSDKSNVIISTVSMAPHMHELTSCALKIAISCKLIKCDNTSLLFMPKLKNPPSTLNLSEVEKEYKKAAKRLGAQMSQMSRAEISSILGVKF